MQIVLFLHNLLRWAILLFAFWAVFKAIGGLSSRKAYSAADRKPGLMFMIFFDIQLLLGLWLYFGNSWFTQLKEGGAEVMKNAALRFFTVEHTLMMIIAWILVHVGQVAVKRAPENKKHRNALIFFGLSLLLILASIPWPFREAIARPWFRGF